jgi:hypothetical protein
MQRLNNIELVSPTREAKRDMGEENITRNGR